jgi:hypothetical protein
MLFALLVSMLARLEFADTFPHLLPTIARVC